MAQQQLGQPVPAPHQITPDIVAGADQVPCGFLLHARNPDLDDLLHPQQPGQMQRIRASVLIRSAAGRCSFDGAAITHRTPPAVSCRGESKPVGPAS